MLAAHRKRQRTWRIARIVGALLLAAYFVSTLAQVFRKAFSPYVVHHDQVQGVWQFWRYHVDGALPPGQLLTDYAFAYHSPPVHWAWLATLSTFIEPVPAAAITHMLAWTLLLIGIVVIVGKQSEWLLGIAAGFIVVRHPEMVTYFGTGLARTLGPFLTVFFLAAFIARRHCLCLALLVIQAGAYPVVAVGCTITYGAYCVIAGPTMRERLRRCAGMFVAGLLIIGLAKYQDIKAPDWWGKIVTLEEAAQMPAWRAGGRFAEVPLRPYVISVARNFTRPYKQNGPKLPSASLNKLVDDYDGLLVVIPAALAAVAIARDRRRRFLQGTKPDRDARFPWQILALIAGSVAAYTVARIFAFQMHLPQRHLAYIIPFVVMPGLPLLVWCGARAVVGARPAVALAITVALTIVPAFVLRGTGIVQGSAYGDHGHQAPLWDYVKTLPHDANIGCDLGACDVIGVLTGHAAWTNRTMTHPWRKGLYTEQERRLVEMSRMLFATSFESFVARAEKAKLDYFLYATRSLKAPPTLYQPAQRMIEGVFKTAQPAGFVLAAPPADAVIFKWTDYRVIDIKKMRKWLDAQGPRPSASSTSPPEPSAEEKPPAPIKLRDFGRDRRPKKMPLRP